VSTQPITTLADARALFFASTPIPPTLDPYAQVPVLLKGLLHWVVWKLEKRDGKDTKIPYNAKTNRNAKVNDPSTWTTFEHAVEVYNGGRSGYTGIGFMLHGTDLVGVDFDGVIHNGVAEPFVLDILEKLGNPYCEVTPSGNGLRAFVQCAKLPEGKRKLTRKMYGAEIYSGAEGGRYLTVTGNQFQGNGIPKIDDISLPYLLISQIEDERFKKLWTGDISAYGDDPSAADYALCKDLARLLNKDRERVEAYFNASKLGQREKWTGRKDYRDRTIKAALGGEKTTDRPSSQDLEFHLPAVETGSHRDFVISPAPNQKDGWFPLGAVSLVGGASGASKTTWMLQLLLAQAIKAPFHGHSTYGRSYSDARSRPWRRRTQANDGAYEPRHRVNPI